ncbi:MAG: hypothetical protein CMJ13_08960 [Pelagibacterales bacterium]|nr:hypothetical protein [Pelagibacterales bacterium]|tara:strand:- start:777 stop:1427 length:651 start_codon:yes stop_codon:yes gene_type:complete
MVVLSNNEIISVCSRALQSLCISSGSEIENARNIAYLEAIQLPALDSLFREIEHIKEGQQSFGGEKNCNDIPSAFTIGQSLIDSAIIQNQSFFEVVRSPLIVLAEAVRRCPQYGGFTLSFCCEGRQNVAVYHKNQLKLKFSVEPNSIASKVELKLVRQDKNLPLHNFEIVKNTNIIHDIVYCIDKWRVICAEAQKTLVPNSITSRASAGAMTNDSL